MPGKLKLKYNGSAPRVLERNRELPRRRVTKGQTVEVTQAEYDHLTDPDVQRQLGVDTWVVPETKSKDSGTVTKSKTKDKS